MTTLKDAGVDIEKGDAASRVAFLHAQSTFASRQGRFGQAVAEEGGFAGLLDFGDFYVAMNCDGVGTKIDIATKLQKFDGLGYDLLAMVADDAVCLGAETISMTNTFDTDKVRQAEIEEMMKSLAKACIEQEVVISGGEIAEMNTLCNGTMWNATSVGVVNKDKVIDSGKIAVGDCIISLNEKGLRSNGFSLVRKIIADGNLGQEYEKYALTPSQIYSDAVLALHGRKDEPAQVEIHGIAHITGGGIHGNLRRILKKTGLGARLDDIFSPERWILDLQKFGKVTDLEAYNTWNMGNGMMIVLPESDAQRALDLLWENGIRAQKAGVITQNPAVIIKNQGAWQRQKFLEY